ncbi:hypothetical protein BS639_21965 [Rouxiella silvae]|uniref:Uncharacterized protein n=1 Tax=Rouxiella silvae TaxID=1646373 RepID=A0ABX3TUZ5_9GAMM|nr:hypothetical protein [Rouxiella silvae]ORJ19052.1 hypothetical protein BS639_21965 [Rouxiella silvae]
MNEISNYSTKGNQALDIHMESLSRDCKVEIKNFDGEDFISSPQDKVIKESDCFKERLAAGAKEQNNKAESFSVIGEVGNMTLLLLDFSLNVSAIVTTGGTHIIPPVVKFLALSKDATNATLAI